MPLKGTGQADDPRFADHFIRLWNANIPTLRMGEILGISKNAVCGLRRRLGLAARPHAIRTKGQQPTSLAAPSHKTPERPAATTLAEAARPVARATGLGAGRGVSPEPSLTIEVSPPSHAQAPAQETPPLPSPSFPSKRAGDCRYPIGLPADPGFRFCGEPVSPPVKGRRSSYCPAHRELVFSKAPTGARPRERQEHRSFI